MGKVLILNYNVCNGCYNCQIACKDEHVANDWTPIAKEQPDTGQFWNRIFDNVRGQVPKVRITYEHAICQHCDEAPCIEACRSDAIYKRDDGIVIIDPEKCRGHQMCITACPWDGIISFNDTLNIAQKCTFCAHLLDNGWQEPRCVDACPTEAMVFGEEEDPKIQELMAQATPLRPDLEVKPRVFYIGLPKRFIAGAVYDPDDDRCTLGATVTARNLSTGDTFSTITDSYGDFWFNDMEMGTYSLLIEKEGFRDQMISPVDISDKDLNVGDVQLFKK